MKKVIILGLMFLVILALAMPAKATIIVSDWTLDLTGVDGLGATVITDIQQITYYGVAHLEGIVDGGTVGLPDIGDIAAVDGHLAATSYIDTGGSIMMDGLNSDYEITFDYSSAIRFITQPLPSADFVHIDPSLVAGVDGFMDIWVNNFDNIPPDAKAASLTGDGYTDGVQIARLMGIAGDGGVFTPLTFDGVDDATFKLLPDCLECFVLAGVFLADIDGDGFLEDLALIAPELIAAVITDGNFDADPQNQGGFSLLEPTNWSAYFSRLAGGDDTVAPFDGYADNSTAMAFYAYEDGSARLGYQIPEPSTILLLGAGLLGIGAYYRRRR